MRPVGLRSTPFFTAFPATLSGLASPEKQAEARLSGLAQGWPSDLPVEQTSKYDLVLDRKAANQYKKGKHRS
jgi:hypothetical protein